MTMNKDRFESLDQMADETAAALAQAAASSAFHLFRDAQFRRLARFTQLSQTEQDRIFNELVLASLVLVMLMFEAPDLRIPRESRDYLAGVKEKIPKAYLDNLKNLGVEAEHIRDWDKLISMRYEEYARDRHDVRAAAMEIESSEKSLDLDSLSKIQMLVPVQAVAIGCHHHICRGETQGQDELFKCALSSLSRFYVELRVRIEGGKITPLTKARAAVKRALHRKGKKKR
jgi:HD superfamily phosphohydrolase